MLAENPERNLSDKQAEFARTSYASGCDLQSLINDILGMAKIESGTITLDPTDISFTDLQEHVERIFIPVAQNKGLAFTTELGSDLPANMYTHSKRLVQLRRNLLSNSLNFTE